MSDENRINPLTVANAESDKRLAPISNGTPVIPQWLVKGAVVLVALAGVVLTLPAGGIALPPVVLAIAGGVVALGSALGIASPGARKTEKP